MAEAGVTGANDATEPRWQVLMAVGEQIFTLNRHFEVLRPQGRYVALGSGRQAAYGALDVLAEQEHLDLEPMVERALLAATRCVVGVRGPLVLESTLPAAG
ncbi:MAG: hypothetical protein HC897_07185 [Thermoanaerobaculia bacterium]|nr:hypothetical protein [Thermoanaerobaculia bacterium]